jgi:hypothetical protein
MVVIKLIEPMIEDNPVKCNEKIIISNDDKFIVDNGT